MIQHFLQLGGVRTEKEFYSKFRTPQDFDNYITMMYGGINAYAPGGQTGDDPSTWWRQGPQQTTLLPTPGMTNPQQVTAPAPQQVSRSKASYDPNSLVDYLKKTQPGQNYSTVASRRKLAEQYGIKNYKGDYDQNVELMRKIKAASPTVPGPNKVLPVQKLGSPSQQEKKQNKKSSYLAPPSAGTSPNKKGDIWGVPENAIPRGRGAANQQPVGQDENGNPIWPWMVGAAGAGYGAYQYFKPRYYPYQPPITDPRRLLTGASPNAVSGPKTPQLGPSGSRSLPGGKSAKMLPGAVVAQNVPTNPTGVKSAWQTFRELPIIAKASRYIKPILKTRQDGGPTDDYDMQTMQTGGGVNFSIVDYLKSIGYSDTSYKGRKKLAEMLNVKNYKGTAKQNLEIMSRIQQDPELTNYYGNRASAYTVDQQYPQPGMQQNYMPPAGAPYIKVPSAYDQGLPIFSDYIEGEGYPTNYTTGPSVPSAYKQSPGRGYANGGAYSGTYDAGSGSYFPFGGAYMPQDFDYSGGLPQFQQGAMYANGGLVRGSIHDISEEDVQDLINRGYKLKYL